MESIEDVSKNLKKCRKLAKKVIDLAIPIMLDIDKKDEDLIEDLSSEYPYITKPKLFSILKKSILNFVKDPERVLKEIDGFSGILLEEGDKNIHSYEMYYPFLISIWCGDAYDKEKNTGLKELIKDLEKYLKIVEDSENFIEYTKKKYLY